jgi:hypothetical protein
MPFKKNMLKISDGVVLPTETNNYGLQLRTYPSVKAFEIEQKVTSK